MRALNRVTSFVPPPPADDSVAGKDRIVVVQVHPYGKEPSFTSALGNAVCESLTASGEGIGTAECRQMVCCLSPLSGIQVADGSG